MNISINIKLKKLNCIYIKVLHALKSIRSRLKVKGLESTVKTLYSKNF